MRRTYLWAILFVGIVFLTACPQILVADNAHIDSLWTQVNMNSKESPKIALNYAQQLLKEAKEQNDRKVEAKAKWSIAYMNCKLGNFTESMEAYFEVALLYEALSDDENLANTYFNIARGFANINNHPASVTYYKRALDMYLVSNNLNGIQRTNFKLGRGYVNLREFDMAKYHLDLALKLTNKKKENRVQKIHNWLGILAYELGDMETAIKEHDKSLKLARSAKNKIGEVLYLFNLGEAYFKLYDIARAREYTLASLELGRLMGNVDQLVKPLILLSTIAKEERGESVAEVNELVAVIKSYDESKLNHYLSEALDHVSTEEYQRELNSNDKTIVIKYYANQSKVSDNLYAKMNILLLQHSVDASMNNQEVSQKVASLEERSLVQWWSFGFVLFVLAGLFCFFYQYKKGDYLVAKEKQDFKFEEMEEEFVKSKVNHTSEVAKIEKKLKEINIKLLAAKQRISKNEEDSIEKSLIIDLKDADFKEIDDENTTLIKQKVQSNEVIIAMESRLLESNELMHQMNKYIWDVIIELQHKGYDVPPPLWNIRGRDN